MKSNLDMSNSPSEKDTFDGITPSTTKSFDGVTHEIVKTQIKEESTVTAVEVPSDNQDSGVTKFVTHNMDDNDDFLVKMNDIIVKMEKLSLYS